MGSKGQHLDLPPSPTEQHCQPLSLFFFFFYDRVTSGYPGSPGTHSAAHPGITYVLALNLASSWSPVLCQQAWLKGTGSQVTGNQLHGPPA